MTHPKKPKPGLDLEREAHRLNSLFFWAMAVAVPVYVLGFLWLRSQ